MSILFPSKKEIIANYTRDENGETKNWSPVSTPTLPLRMGPARWPFYFGLKAVSSLPTMYYERGGKICLETRPKIFPPKLLPAMHLF